MDRFSKTWTKPARLPRHQLPQWSVVERKAVVTETTRSFPARRDPSPPPSVFPRLPTPELQTRKHRSPVSLGSQSRHHKTSFSSRITTQIHSNIATPF